MKTNENSTKQINPTSTKEGGRTKRLTRNLILATATAVLLVTSLGVKPASADVFVAGNRVQTGSSCGFGSALYSVFWGNQGYAQQVRVYTKVYGGSTTVTPWTKAADAGTYGAIAHHRAPRGSYYAIYLEYRQYNVTGVWYSGGEWVPMGGGTVNGWCRA